MSNCGLAEFLSTLTRCVGKPPYLRTLYWEYWARECETGGAAETQIRESIDRRTTYDQDALLVDQLRWLQAAGFESADCIYKHHFIGVFWAARPRSAPIESQSGCALYSDQGASWTFILLGGRLMMNEAEWRKYWRRNEWERLQLQSLVEKLSDEDLTRPMPSGWTPAAVLAHLAFWDIRAHILVIQLEAGRGDAVGHRHGCSQ